MVERFFATGQRRSPPHEPLTLLSGPPSSGKTSLLFQYAFNAALENRGAVIFICNRRKLERKPPYLSQVHSRRLASIGGEFHVQGIDPSSDTFRCVQMKYVDDDDGIKKYFSAFHVHETYPTTVIIDDFVDFFDERNCQDRYSNARGRDLAMVRILALCRDAVTRATEATPCELLLSDTHNGDSPRLLYIYKRWVSSIYTIKGDGVGSFLLRNSSYVGTGSQGGVKKIAKYSIALQYLVLEGLGEDEEK